jgi:hypothetical protein
LYTHSWPTDPTRLDRAPARRERRRVVQLTGKVLTPKPKRGPASALRPRLRQMVQALTFEELVIQAAGVVAELQRFATVDELDLGSRAADIRRTLDNAALNLDKLGDEVMKKQLGV